MFSLCEIDRSSEQMKYFIWKVREKEDRHQQQKLDGFLRPRGALVEQDAPAAGAATAVIDMDMEVRPP